MKLEDYLLKNKISYREFAERMQVSHTCVAKWIKGTRPRKQTARIIFFETNQKVKLKDLGW